MSTDALREATARLEEARAELEERLAEAQAARLGQQATVDAAAPFARPRATREAIVRLVYGRSTGYEPELYVGNGRDARRLDNVNGFVLEQAAGPGELPRLTLHTIAPELPPELETFAQVLDTSAARLQLAKYALREAMSMARLEEAVRCAVEEMHTTNWVAFSPEKASELRRQLIQACVDSARASTERLERGLIGTTTDDILAAAYQCYVEARQFHEDVGVEEDDKDARDIRLDLQEHLEEVMALCSRLLRERRDPGAPVPAPEYRVEMLLPERNPAAELLSHMVQRVNASEAQPFPVAPEMRVPAAPTPAQALGLPDGAALIQRPEAVPQDMEPGKVPALELPPEDLLAAAQAQAAQGAVLRDGELVTPAEAKVIDRMAGASTRAPATATTPAPGPAGTPPDAAPGNGVRA